MDAISALENGLLALPAPAEDSPPVVRGAVLARDWAISLGLRCGNTCGPSSAALVPLVDAWARERGSVGPGHRDVGRGLEWAGLRKRMQSAGRKHIVLHRDDAAKLWALVRAAWAPGFAPGDPLSRPKKPKRPVPGGRQRGVHPPPAAPLFHEVLARDRRTKPVVDTLCRVWPGVAEAARALGGFPKSISNPMAHLGRMLSGQAPAEGAAGLGAALSRGVAWRGVWWRHLTPAEVAAVPAGHVSGAVLPGFGWGLVCPHCGGRPAGK